jgi:hypothetical protein
MRRFVFILTTCIGNAKILNSTTGDNMPVTNNMSNCQFTVALMLFVVAYCVFEAPSNLMLKILTPNRCAPTAFSCLSDC